MSQTRIEKVELRAASMSIVLLYAKNRALDGVLISFLNLRLLEVDSESSTSPTGQ
jgi:hypothetical protein